MTQTPLVVQAKEGNPSAIAALLNRALQPKGMTATAQLEGNCLTVELSSAQPIHQANVMAFIQQGMNRLQPQRIQTVIVFAQTDQVGEFAWMESFLLVGVTTSLSSSLLEFPPIADTTSSTPAKLNPSQSDGVAESITKSSRSPKQPSAKSLSSKRQAPISAKGIEALLLGFAIAIALFNLGFLKVLFNGAVILVHEVGHAVTHWVFGRPAIPTVNIYFGGGVTIPLGQVWLLNVLIYLGIAYFIYRLQGRSRLQGTVALLTLGYTYCLFTPTNQMLAVFMGHGMELVAIAVCLYLAASGKLCRIPGDRTIYAMLGFFIFFSATEFYWKLLQNPEFREWYEGGIGGIIDNDLVILANEYFQVDLSRIATVLLFASLLAPAIGLLACYMKRPLQH